MSAYKAYNDYVPMHSRLYEGQTYGVKPATRTHLINILIKLSKRHNNPLFDGYEYTSSKSLAEYMLNAYGADQIDWASQQVVQFYRESNQKYRAFEGRGRPVGAKNRNNRVQLRQDNYDATDDLINAYPSETSADKPASAALDAGDFDKVAELIASKISPMFVKQSIFSLHESEQQETFTRVENFLQELAQKINNIKDNRPTLVEIKVPELPPISAGIQHKNFPLLLQAANARMRNGHRLNVWLHGPAGTGKTTAAEKLADVLGLKFWYNGALGTKYELVGFPDANGKVFRTAFREAWEHGGVYLFDEIDGSMPDALMAMNGALANSIAPFPDGMIRRHPDCVVIAGANTTGLGGGIEYVGAMKQNAAFLNRFFYVDWPHDDGLEDALCANKEWLARVRYVRERWKASQIKSQLITMRATIFGEALLAAGIPQEQVEEMTLKCGMTDAQWNMIK